MLDAIVMARRMVVLMWRFRDLEDSYMGSCLPGKEIQRRVQCVQIYCFQIVDLLHFHAIAHLKSAMTHAKERAKYGRS